MRERAGRLWKRLRKGLGSSTANKIFVGTVLIVIGAAYQPTVTALGDRFERPSPPPPLPTLDTVADFIPAGYRVVRRVDVNMDGAGPEETVLHVVGVPDRDNAVPAKFLVVAWDGEARRWTVVFDSARRYPRWDEGPFIDLGTTVADPDVLPLAVRDGRTDVVIGATLLRGAGASSQVVGVVTFDGNVADLAYAFRATGAGAVQVVGTPPAQTLRVTAAYYTQDDALCCPARQYEFVLAPRDEYGHLSYVLVADDRPWAGVVVTAAGGEAVRVVEVGAGGPAAGLLRPRDVIVGVRGADPDSPVRHQIAKHRPGDVVTLVVRRGGARIEVPVTLASLMAYDGVPSYAPGELWGSVEPQQPL